jgi:large subunit ribosomal protein L25
VADFTIEAQPRQVTGKKSKQLRRDGLVPAVVYGPGIKPFPIQIPYRPLEVTLMKAGGTNLIDIAVAGKKHVVLTREVQRHILRGDIMHVDFFALDMNQPITADVFIQFIGESPAVANGEGILLTGTSSLSFETLPTKLVSEVQIDLSTLENVGDAIHVRDVNLGEDFTIHNDPDELLARVIVPSAVLAEEGEGLEGAELEGEEVDAASVGRVGEDEEDFDDE